MQIFNQPLKVLALTLALLFARIGFFEPSQKLIWHLGILLPKGSQQIGLNRFVSSRSYEDTKREFYFRFKRSAFIKQAGEEINLPHVRTISYRNFAHNGKFFAINIYLEVKTGLTKIFFVNNTKKE